MIHYYETLLKPLQGFVVETNNAIAYLISLLLALFALLLTILGVWIPGIILLLGAIFLPAVWTGEITSQGQGKLIGCCLAVAFFAFLYAYGAEGFVYLILLAAYFL